ncbi:MAG: DUF3793 family protein [Firmicutes bacterium]|nr:DUF3793 family protein [Bacillota bacterium]
MNRCDACDDREYLRAILTAYTAPTVFGGKTGTLVNLCSPTRDLSRCWMCDENLRCAIPLAHAEFTNPKGSLLLYFYDRKKLEHRLKDRRCRAFLKNRGYNYRRADEAIAELKRRFLTGCPDEIGIFLGYPLSDVEAFCEKRKHRFVGYWKCYENILLSKIRFFFFDLAKYVAMKRAMQEN